MNLMLAVLMLCVVLGVVAARFGRREQFVIGLMATTMTSLYFFFARLA